MSCPKLLKKEKNKCVLRCFSNEMKVWDEQMKDAGEFRNAGAAIWNKREMKAE